MKPVPMPPNQEAERILRLQTQSAIEADSILRLQCLAAAGNSGTTEQQILRARTIYAFVTGTTTEDATSD